MALHYESGFEMLPNFRNPNVRLFPDTVRCEETSGACAYGTQGRDFRDNPAPIDIPDSPGGGFEGRFVNLADLERASVYIAKCPGCGRQMSLGNVVGVYFHPSRNRWVVLGGAESYPGRFFNYGDSTLRGPDALYLRFPRDRVVYVDVDRKDAAGSLFSASIACFGVDGGRRFADLPIQPEYLDLVDPAYTHPVIEGPDKSVTYFVRLHGMDPSTTLEIRYQEGSIVRIPKTYLEVWPDLPDWRSYWLFGACYPETGDSRLTDWKISTYCRTFNNRSLVENKFPNWVKLDGVNWGQNSIVSAWPEYVCFHNAKVNASGLIRLELPAKRPPALTPGSISIDFGTSRSVVMVAPTGNDDPNSFKSFLVAATQQTRNGGVSFRNRAATRTFSRCSRLALNGAETHQAEKAYVPTSAHRAAFIQNSEAGPSVMMVRSVLSQAGMASIGKHNELVNAVPFMDFTITPKDIQSLGKDFPAEKWNLSNARPTVNAFLKALLLMASAEHQYIYPGQTPQFTYSFPLAFSTADQRLFFTCLQEAGAWLSSCVPDVLDISGQLPDPRTMQAQKAFSESLATMEAARAANQSSNEIIVVADLGGGTLDLGVWVRELGDESSDQATISVEQMIRNRNNARLTPLLSDSVKLGADTILHLLYRVIGMSDKDKQSTRWKIFEDGYGRLREDYDKLPAWKTFNKGVDKWFDFIVDYIARTLVCARGQREIESVKLVLAGGGWKSLEARDWNAVDLKRELQLRLEERIRALCDKPSDISISVLTTLLETGLEKVAVAGGLSSISADGRITAKGILTCNGIVEEHVSGNGKKVSWLELVGDNNGRKSLWEGVGLHLEKSNIVPRIPHISKLSENDVNIINSSLYDATDANGYRQRSALSIVLECVASNEIG